MKKLTPGFAKLVSILNDGHFHDGTRLGETLGITRSAVWKAIKKLAQYGIPVESIKGKGYALLESLIMLNSKIIKQGLNHKEIKLDIFETLASTNDYLRATRNNKIQICLAEQQTLGKGRLGREWHSPFGQNLYLSIAYSFQKDVSELAGLSLAVCLAVVKTLETYALPKAVAVKWPNDVLYDHQKICGNLIEIQAESHGTSHVVIGLGINVNMMQNEEGAIEQAWTSLRKSTGNYIDRNQLAILVINNVIDYLELFETKGLAYFLDTWHAADYLINQEISLKTRNTTKTGKAFGIDGLGNLRLKISEGKIESFSSGDTSVLKRR